MNATSVSSTRRYDFDWLRVLLILTVLVFHSMRFFDMEDWNVKNANTYLVVQVLVIFVSRWMMPAIFLISGVATFYALGKRRGGGFVKERALRLLVPLLVGLFTHIPYQVYLYRVTHNQFSGSFWQWYPSIFTEMNQLEGNFNWFGCHLWYLEALFVISLACLPLFLWLRHGSGKRVLAWLGNRLSGPGAVYLPVLLVILLSASFNPDNGSILTGEKFGGWNMLSYLAFFICGFVLASSPAMQASIRRIRWVSLTIGATSYLVFGICALMLTDGNIAFGSPLFAVGMALLGLCCWGCMLALLGFGMQRLNVRTPVLDYASEAVMPFYVMHQTVLFGVGYYVMTWAIPDLAKWAITLIGTFAIILALYEFLVRRNNVLRVLFGMKQAHKDEVMVRKPAAQVS